jgi:hypothetical protein
MARKDGTLADREGLARSGGVRVRSKEFLNR